MTEARVRELFVSFWSTAPQDEVLVETQQAICKEVLVEVAGQTRIDLDETGAERFLKMVAAICRLSHFHSLRENSVNNIPPSYWEHLGFITAAYKEAARYCHENYDEIARFDFVGGRTKEEMQKLTEQAQKRDEEIKTEIRRANRATFSKEEFRALHELFCFVIQATLGREIFAKYTRKTNEAFAFLRKQQALLNLPQSINTKPF